MVDESLITGDPVPVTRRSQEIIAGGSEIKEGSAKVYVVAGCDETILAEVARMADRAGV